MGRNVKKDPGAELTPVEQMESLAEASAAPAGEEGGAPGIVHVSETLNPPVLTIPGMKPPPRAVKEDPKAPKPKRYVVKGGPDHVIYGGVKVPMRHGKVYTEHTVDLDLLRRQGCIIEELVD
jgi:hypothetical protein